MYEGEWFDGYKHGPGTYTNKNGRSLIGFWENGVRVKVDKNGSP